MKLLAVIVLCGLAAASATADSSAEYGLIEDVQDYLAKFAEKVRQHLQDALNKLKEKIQEHKYLFEALKEQISNIQQKIKDLVNSAKETLVQKARQVQGHLFNLLQKYLEYIHDSETDKLGYALYEVEEGSFFERLADRIKGGLENLLTTVMEKVEKYTDIANDIKDRVLAIKEKLQEIPKAGVAKLLEIAQKIREQIKALLREVIEKVSHKEEQEGNLYALYEDNQEGFLERLSKRIKSQLERFLERVVELVNKYTDIFEGIKEKVRAIKDKLAEIPKAGLAKLLEIAQKVKEQIQNLLKEVVDKIAKKQTEEPVGYAVYESEGGFLERLADRIKTAFENAVENIQKRIEKYADIAQEFKSKIVDIKEKLQELTKASGLKLLELAQKIQQQLKDLLNDALNKISNREVAEYSAMNSVAETLLENVARVLREKLQDTLNAIRSRLEQHKEVFEAFKSKLEDFQEQITELSKATFTKVIAIAGNIRVKLSELIKVIAEKIGNFHIGFSYTDGIRKPGQFSQRRLQTHFDELKNRVAKYPEVQAQFQSQLDEVQSKIDAVADLSGLELALTSSKVQREIGFLRKKILDVIGTKPPTKNYADEERKPGETSRRRLQTQFDELKKRVAKYPDVQAKFQEQLDEVQSKVDAVADLSGFNLALTSSRVMREIGSLRNKILDIIGTRPPPKP